MSDLLQKLEGIKIRFDEVGQQIVDPDIIADMKRYIKLNKEYKDLEVIVNAYYDYKNTVDNIQSSKEVLDSNEDADFKDMAALVTQRPPAGITRLNSIGGTPFLLAARTADTEFMRLLVELGADPLLPNNDNSTPLMVAAGLGTSSPGEDPGTEPEVVEAVALALELGGDLNAVDDNGETVMHGAAYKHFPAVVEFLSEAGADIEVWNQENRRGWTPLDIVEGGIHIGMNILRSAPTAAAIREAMTRAGVEPVPLAR